MTGLVNAASQRASLVNGRNGPIPSPLNICVVTLRRMHSVGRSIFTTGLAARVSVKHLGFETVATVVTTEANALSHR